MRIGLKTSAFLALIFSLLGAMHMVSAEETVIYTGDVTTGVKQNTFVLDDNDTGGDVQLQFGTTLQKYLRWEDAQQHFLFTDDVRIDGSLQFEDGPILKKGSMTALYVRDKSDVTYYDIRARNVFANSRVFSGQYSDRFGVGGSVTLGGDTRSVDSVPSDVNVSGHNANAGATVNQNGGDVIINGGNPSDGGGSHGNILIATNTGNVGVGDALPDANLKLDVEGNVGAVEYCDENGANCLPAGGQVFSAYDSGGNTSVSTAESVLNLDAVRVIDSAYGLSNDVVTINQNGLYKFTAHISVDSLNTSGAPRSSLQFRFEDDTSGSFDDVPGAICQDYMREQNNGISSASCSITFIRSYTATDQIRLTHQMSGSTTAQTVPEGSGFTIEMIRQQ